MIQVNYEYILRIWTKYFIWCQTIVYLNRFLLLILWIKSNNRWIFFYTACKGQEKKRIIKVENTEATIELTLPNSDLPALVGICIQPSDGVPCIELLFVYPRSNFLLKVKEGVKSFLQVQAMAPNIKLTFDPLNSTYAGTLLCYGNGDKTAAGLIENCGGQKIIVIRKYILLNFFPYYSFQITIIIDNKL